MPSQRDPFADVQQALIARSARVSSVSADFNLSSIEAVQDNSAPSFGEETRADVVNNSNLALDGRTNSPRPVQIQQHSPDVALANDLVSTAESSLRDPADQDQPETIAFWEQPDFSPCGKFIGTFEFEYMEPTVNAPQGDTHIKVHATVWIYERCIFVMYEGDVANPKTRALLWWWEPPKPDESPLPGGASGGHPPPPGSKVIVKVRKPGSEAIPGTSFPGKQPMTMIKAGGHIFIFIPDCLDLKVAQFIGESIEMEFCPNLDPGAAVRAPIIKQLLERDHTKSYELDEQPDVQGKKKYNPKAGVRIVKKFGVPVGSSYIDVPGFTDPMVLFGADMYQGLFKKLVITWWGLTFYCCDGVLYSPVWWAIEFVFTFSPCPKAVLLSVVAGDKMPATAADAGNMNTARDIFRKGMGIPPEIWCG